MLPGEPLDGSGRVCIHLFVQDESGPFVEPCVIHPVFEDGVQVKQKVDLKPTRGRLACDPKRNVAPVINGNVVTVTHRTEDPRSITCPRCKDTDDYRRMMARQEEQPPPTGETEK